MATEPALTEVQEDFADWLRRHLNSGDSANPSKPAGSGRSTGSRTSGVAHGHDSSCEHARDAAPSAVFHCYSIGSRPDRAWNRWKQISPAEHQAGVWHCTSIWDAAARYSWRDYKGVDSSRAFAKLAARLQKAVRSGNLKNVRLICREIFSWGGLDGRKFLKGVVNKLNRDPNLIRNLQRATYLLQPRSIYPKSGFSSFWNLGLHSMNSAMTKVYCALALQRGGGQSVLMYDGRVASALSYLARRYIAAMGLPQSPAQLGLDFQYDPNAKGRKRYPGAGFLPLAKDAARAEIAKRAALVLQRVLKNNSPSRQFAELEKALFMIGYDVRYYCCGCVRP